MKMRRFFLFCTASFVIFSFFIIGDAGADKKLSYTYDEGSINLVSSSQVNAIEFSVPIVQVNSPPSQLINIFDKNNGPISYVNDNKVMLFYLANGINAVQFMVTLKNGHVLSLYFNADKSMGRIVHISEKMSGGSVQENKADHYALLKKHQNYDVKIERIMRAAFLDDHIGSEWVKVKELAPHHYKEFNIKKYTEWDNVLYKIGIWDFCSNSKNALVVDYERFINGRKVLASTLTSKKLLPHGCAKLILLYAKDEGRAV